jgi:hypothetical protein
MTTFMFRTASWVSPQGTVPLQKVIRRTALVAALVFAFASCLAANAFGQGTTGSIAGTVTDPSGAPISGATVTVRQESGQDHVIKTSDVGSYRVPQLNPC